MDCEYLLVCRIGLSQSEFPFSATTPEEATDKARNIVKRVQGKNVEEFPFAPIRVNGVLYRGFCEIDGGDFVTPKL